RRAHAEHVLGLRRVNNGALGIHGRQPACGDHLLRPTLQRTNATQASLRVRTVDAPPHPAEVDAATTVNRLDRPVALAGLEPQTLLCPMRGCLHSPPREEGWPRHQENGAKPPLWSGRGGCFRVTFRCSSFL